MPKDKKPAQNQDDEDTGVQFLRDMSEKLFHWTDEDHRRSADEAQSRIKELQETEANQMFKFPMTGRIEALKRAAAYHLSKIKQSAADKLYK